jgi:hypothetical protein
MRKLVQKNKFKTNQKESYKGHDWWNWAVWIEAKASDLQAVKSVTYTLHSSYNNPIRTIESRKTNFRLKSAGWGEFTIPIEIKLNDGSVERLKHALKLHYPDDKKKPLALIQIVDQPPSETAEHTEALLGAIIVAAPKAEVKAATGHTGTRLKVRLTGSTVNAVAKGVQLWLARNSGVKLQLITGQGKTKNAHDISFDNVSSIFRNAKSD